MSRDTVQRGSCVWGETDGSAMSPQNQGIDDDKRRGLRGRQNEVASISLEATAGFEKMGCTRSLTRVRCDTHTDC